MSESKGQDPFAHWFREALHHSESDSTPSQDIVALVMRSLPAGAPAFYSALAALVVEAWEDKPLRAALRARPRDTLAARGFTLPQGVSVRLVPLDEAALPTTHSVFLPLEDPAGQPAPRDAKAARELLAGTDWRWLLESPVAASPYQGRLETSSFIPAPSLVPVESRSPFAWRRWLSRPALIWAGAAAVVLVAWASLAEGTIGTGLDGPLSGTADGAPPWAMIAIAIAALTVLIWWSSRKGG